MLFAEYNTQVSYKYPIIVILLNLRKYFYCSPEEYQLISAICIYYKIIMLPFCSLKKTYNKHINLHRHFIYSALKCARVIKWKLIVLP